MDKVHTDIIELKKSLELLLKILGDGGTGKHHTVRRSTSTPGSGLVSDNANNDE
jgi:hypothetical protein